MANYANLKATINANIKANGNEEITGPILNTVLNQAVTTLGAGYQYMGVATPATSPGTPDANVFYIAATPGTYTNFGGAVVADGEVAILKYNGSWTKEVSGAATAAQVTQLGQEVDELEEVAEPYKDGLLMAFYSLMSATISTTGAFAGNTNFRTFRWKCRANTTYAISNPYGGALRIASSATEQYAPSTFTNFKIASNTTSETYTTGASDFYLYVCFYEAQYASESVGDCYQALTIKELSAIDYKARKVTDSATDTAVSISANLYNPAEHYQSGRNMENSGNIVGSYSDRCVLGLIPVYGLTSISVALVSPAGVTGSTRYCFYGPDMKAIANAVGGAPSYGETNNTIISVPAGAYYFACLVYYAKVELDTNGAPLAMVQSGDVYTGYVPFGKSIVGDKGNRPKDIYVCAKNSPRKYRFVADYYCDGVNDELTLQTALNAVGDNGTLYLAPGDYWIDSFPTQSDGQHCAIQYKTDPQTRVKIKAYDQTPMREDGYSIINHCATLRVSSTCYSALDANTDYSVIGVSAPNATRVWNGACFDIEGVGIRIPGNQKKVIAFDAYYAFCMMMFKCMATAIPTNAMPSVAGVDGCVGIRCTKGSNFGQESQINTCAMYGFGQGIAVMGEHYVITNAKTIYNKYGFTFNWYGSTDGGYSHPNTLINCCSEMDFNYPYFGQTNQRQSLTLIDFNMEHRTAAFAMGGNRATELVPGTWRGTIHYTIKVYGTDGYNITGNSVELPFWADGCGENMKSVNDAQAKSLTSAILATYAPNFGQVVWVTDLSKHLICTNADTKEWRDFSGNIVVL